MNFRAKLIAVLCLSIVALTSIANGWSPRCCRTWPCTPPLGSSVDAIMKLQEDNAEVAKFTIYMHEFELNNLGADGARRGYRLNTNGEDHVKQIAAALRSGASHLVVVERSNTTAKENTQFNFPVHLSDELDRQRRKIVVSALAALGVDFADRLVIVAPAFAEGLNSEEAARAYSSGINGGGGGGFGGGFGGGYR